MEESNQPKQTFRLDRRLFLKAALGTTGMALLSACAPAPAPTPTTAAQPAAAPTAAPQATLPPQATAAAPTPVAATKTGTETIRIAIGVDPDSLDPLGQTTTTIQNILDYMYESLTRLGEDGKIYPGLAEKWDMSEDGKTYTFKLREGVTFHDGEALTAEAVKLSWDRILNQDMKMPLRSPMELVEAVEPVDKTTVKFQLKSAFPPFIAAMAGVMYGIVSPNIAKNYPTSWCEEPVGTGPYQFKSRTKGSEMVMVRNDKYWGQKPYYQATQIRIVPEAATRESLILANQADIMILPPVSDIPKLQQNNQVKVLLAPSNRTIFMAIDVMRPGPFQDKKFRQALNYAVDKEGIIKSILFGLGDVMDAPMSPMLWGYSKIGAYPYDPAKAKQILSEGGWTGTNVKMIYCTGRYVQDGPAAQAIANNLRDVGLNVEATTMDWPTYVATFTTPPEQSTVDIHLLGWAPGYLDAAQAMEQFRKMNHPPAGLASSRWSTPRSEELLDAALKELNPDTRAKMYAEAAQIIMDECPWIFLWVQKFPIVHSAKIKGVGSIPNEKWSAIYAEPA